ncbi:MAG TPA: NAD(P)-dependent oxidoreductase [Gaiellaceae bacterium]|jgi:nucleoside-diphosphate-sugar epimerase|nr:NAD(P)-dependent oxidoreductase [Gaiellaceae bacterium]
MRIFLAGATGAIGKRLVPQLIAGGHQVTATTRSADKVELLRALGAEPVIVDGLDAVGIGEAVARAEPEAIIHQMTALSGTPDMKHFDRWFATTNELRTRGTEHLLAAAQAAGIARFVAQSYTNWTNMRDGGGIKDEDDPFDPNPPKAQTETLAAIRFLEQAVLAAPLEGIVLRYGNFYGPGASESLIEMVKKRKMPLVGNGAGVWSWIHLDDAASAAVVAVERGTRGMYNIVDDDPAPLSEWLPYLADAVGARRPMHVPVWLGKLAAGEVGVSMTTQIRGSSNERAKRELGWQPSWCSWRDGFKQGLSDPAMRTRQRKPLAAA